MFDDKDCRFAGEVMSPLDSAVERKAFQYDAGLNLGKVMSFSTFITSSFVEAMRSSLGPVLI
jgi:hypothetical protein